jgi:triacylglycerol lipase
VSESSNPEEGVEAHTEGERHDAWFEPAGAFDHDPSVEHTKTELWREAKWPLEWLALRLSRVYRGCGVPRGSGEPVLIVPGFLGGDLMMLDLYWWLLRIGYRPYLSHITWNTDCPDHTARHLAIRTRSLHKKTGEKVRLIGHSLGGMLAKCVAQEAPEVVDRVITLGSPFREMVRAHPAVVGLWDQLKLGRGLLVGRNLGPSCGTGHCMCTFVQCMLDPKPTDVPQFAIYSKKDGVAAWESCIGDDPSCNFEVDSTHIGMAFSAPTYRVIAERLNGAA